MDGCDDPGIEQSQRKEILKWGRISSDLGKRELSETEFSRATSSNRNLRPQTCAAGVMSRFHKGRTNGRNLF